MNTTPKVSVIITAYNDASGITATLDAVRSQTMKNWECVIVNDGSQDDTHQAISDYIKKTEDQRLILINREMTNPAEARNAGLTAARGKFLVFYEAGDIVPEEAFTVMTGVADDKRADLVIGNLYFAEMGKKYQNPAAKRLTSRKRIHPFDEDLLNNATLCNKLFVRDIVVQNNIRFSGPERAEDLLFCLQYIGKSQMTAPSRATVCVSANTPFWAYT